MNAEFWMQRWQAKEIGFHQMEVHDLLARHWQGLDLAPGSKVLVPLCGKTLDMVWLAAAGHRIVGVELSPIAVDEFFAEQRLVPETAEQDGFIVKRAGPFTLFCGDFFALTTALIGDDIAAAYDRAALVALPPSMQPAYAAKLAELLPAGAVTLLVSLAYPEGQLQGPPFSTPLMQVAGLFGATQRISVVETRDGLETSQNLKARGVTRLEEAGYIMRRKS